ncbi:MAG: FAD-dependent oxidoreductase [Minicystis sp.]
MTTAAREAPTVVVGAGIAGLSCARALADAGRPVIVLERARGVGGRCATRRFEDQPIDFGAFFLHGRNPDFLAALDAVPGTALPGWPVVVQGAGRPCQPEAFAPGERRLAFAEGVYLLPKYLGWGLDVRTGVRVISFRVDGGSILLDVDDGEPVRAGTVIIAVAAEQALTLLTASPADGPALGAARALLGMVRTQPCLTVLAGYPLDVPAPAWHVHFPEDSRVLQVVSHDSTKRPSPSYHALVYQAHPRWSRERLGDDDWPRALLAEAGRIIGPWAAEPRFFHPHRWRYARTDLGAEMAEPLLVHLAGGARLGFAGELFAPGGGIEAAWLSGRRVARRILAEEKT